MSWLSRTVMGNKAQSETNSTSTRTPYGPAVAPINNFIDKIGSLYNGDTPLISPMEQQGYDMVQQTAGSPSASMTESLNTNAAVARGDYLSPDTNPYLADIAKRVGAQALQGVNSTFGSGGRASGGLAGYYAGKGTADALTDFYGGQYSAERGHQMAAVGNAPALEQARYLGPQAMISAGQNISSRPFDAAAQYGSILSNIAGLGGTTTGTSRTEGRTESPGVLSNIANSFVNKLFGQ